MSTRYKRTDWVRRMEDFSSGCSSGFRLGQWLIAGIFAIFTGISRLLPVTRWLSVTLTPGVPVISTVGASSLKSPASIWRGVVFVAFIMGMMGILPVYTHADDITMGGVLVAKPNQPITVTCLGKNAAYTSYLHFYNPAYKKYEFICNSSENGYKKDLGSFSKETELVFKLNIEDTGYDYYTGPASRNPDNEFHALIRPVPDDIGKDTWYFGFEDLFGGGDRDYDDCMFHVTGLKALSYPACGSIPIKVWIDKNGNKMYDSSAGEEVSNASVWLNNMLKGTTNSNGIIKVQAISTDKIYAEKAFYSLDNPKAVDSNFGGSANNPYAVSGIDRKAYNFVMASDVMRKLDGKYYDFPRSGDICGQNFRIARDANGNVLVELVHPKIEWNLVIAFEQAQSASFYSQIETGFRRYADYMYNFTDGYSVVKNVVLVKGKYKNTPQWNYSDVQVKNSEWPNAYIFGNRKNAKLHIHMGKTWSGNGPTGYNWYSTLGHESGHYLLGFYDEYLSGNNQQKGSTWSYRTTHDGDCTAAFNCEPNEFPKNYGLMDYQYTAHEMSDTTDYFSRKKPYNASHVTAQYYKRDKSAWGYFRSFYIKEIQSKMAGQGFSSSFFNNLILPPHLVGNYPNSDNTKRAEPTKMNHDQVNIKSGHRGIERNNLNFFEWATHSSTRSGDREEVFDATIQTVDSSGTPIYQADVWLVSREGTKHFQGKTNHDGFIISNSISLGKRLEAYFNGRGAQLTVNEEKDHYQLTISSPRTRNGQMNNGEFIVSAKPDDTTPSKMMIMVSGNALDSQPSVTLSQSHGYVVNVPMENTDVDLYSGTTEYQYNSGNLEVASDSTQSINAFEIFSTEVPFASGFPAPHGELQMTTTLDSFEGLGAFVITTSAAPVPTNNNLMHVGSVWSFGFANSISAVRNVGFNIIVAPDQMKGLDATQLNLYGWDQASKSWQLIAGGTNNLKSFSTTLASLDYVSYALFAPASDDTVAPNTITDLQAQTGDSRWRVNLQWTTPNDDEGVYVYDIRFNTTPITEENWDDSFAIRYIPNSLVAEKTILEMPDPNKDYYFAIRAADAASNWSSIGTLNTPTKSQSSDTDEDAMLDSWEIQYFGDLSHDGTADTDNDMWTDLEEFENGTNPTVENKVGPYSIFGTILDTQDNPIASVIVQVSDKTVVTNATGSWEINGLAEGEYTVIASKDGYLFDSKSCVVSVNEKGCQPRFKLEPVLDVKVVPEPRIAKQGEDVIYSITVTNQGEGTATGVTLADVLPDNTGLVTIEALDGGSCEAEMLTCSLPDLTPGATANVKVVVSNSQAETLINTVTVTTQEFPTDVKKTWTRVIPYLSVTLIDQPDPIEMLQVLHYSLVVELSHYAPTDATGITLVSQLPSGVELQSITSDYAICDSSAFPQITCQMTDLSVANANSVSHATVEMDVALKDAGLLVLTHEAKITAHEYPAHLVRERTTIFIPEDIQVDLAFVIDVTGSMQQEMNGVIRALTKFTKEIDPSTAPLMALLIFGDEVKVAAFTRDMDVLRGAIADLTASGGGLCEEASVEALLVAIPHTQAGGDILFATDASPYADADVEKVIELLRSKGIRFNAMITGDCSMSESWNEWPN